MAGRFAAGVWEFVVGDDWRVALATVLMLGATALIAAAGLPAWWPAPVAVVAVLYRSVRRATAPR